MPDTAAASGLHQSTHSDHDEVRSSLFEIFLKKRKIYGQNLEQWFAVLNLSRSACRILQKHFSEAEKQDGDVPVLSLHALTSSMTTRQAAKIFYQICGENSLGLNFARSMHALQDNRCSWCHMQSTCFHALEPFTLLVLHATFQHLSWRLTLLQVVTL